MNRSPNFVWGIGASFSLRLCARLRVLIISNAGKLERAVSRVNTCILFHPFRILVDRFWPRGLSKDKVKVDLWQKDIAPSNSLRVWFGHDEKKWDGFRRRYFNELDKNTESVKTILDKARQGSITLLYGAKEERFNNAVALKEYLEAS